MNQAVAVPAWASMITAILLIAGAGITLIGTLGLLRLRTFYERVHAPTLGTTLGTGCIVMASMVYHVAMRDEGLPRFSKDEMPRRQGAPPPTAPARTN